jgi:subtilisin-like proprotein convertase family protein
MYKKITLNKLRSLAIVAIFAICGTTALQAQVYNNGPLSTGATNTVGAAAPAGYTWSELPTVANTTFGSSHSIDAGFSIVDNFTVTGSWSVTSMSFFGYSTGYASTTVSPFNRVFVRIYNTDPGVGSPAPIFGDLTTNRFATSTNSTIYRINRGANATDRLIWQVNANVNVTLPAGNYWVEYQLGTTTTGASNFGPPVTILNSGGAPGGNARQRTIATGALAALLDAGVGQDHPFIVNYTTSPCAGTPAPGNTVSSSSSVCTNIPYTLSLQNVTPGSGVTYQWQSSTTGTAGSYTNIAGATSSTYGTVGTVTTWYQAIVTCGAATATSTPVQVTITPCYCTAGATSTAFEKISRVEFGTINNPSTSTAGYEDFSAITTTAFSGATMPIRVTLSGAFAADVVLVWIDLNNDFDFTDPGELLYTSAAGVGPHNGSITIPASTTPGNKRMRIRMHDSSLGPNSTSCGTSTYGQVEDYTVNIQPCVPATVTTQPVNRSIACGGSTTFTVALAGSLPVAYWEYRTSATGIWQNVPNTAPYSGVNTTTLTLTDVSSTYNGYQYRAVYSGVCAGVDFSAAATLTVTPLIATVTPVSANICNGGSQLFTITTPAGAPPTFTATGPFTVPDANATGILIPVTVSGLPAGAPTGVRVTFNMQHTYVGDVSINLIAPNNAILNLVGELDNGTGSNSSDHFVNTVWASDGTTPISGALAPRTGTYAAEARTGYGPTGFTQTVNNWAGLTAGALNGTWRLAIADPWAGDIGVISSWSISFVYGAATGVFSPTTGLFTNAALTTPYTGTAVNSVYAAPTTTTNYSVVVTTTTCVSSPLSIPVTVNNPITGTSTVANKTVCVGGNTSFTATAPTGGNTIAHQWQVKIGTAAFANIANGGVYNGATTNTLTITGATAAMNGYIYRDSMSVAACNSSLISSQGTLTVNPLPVLTVSANPSSAIYPGQTTTLSVASSTTVPAGGYQWYLNGVPVAGATNNTLVVDVDDLGVYTVTAADANACGSAVTPSITITSAVSDILFIYPSPNSGQFQVRYYSAPGNNPLPRYLNIYDSKGSRVYSRVYPINAPYARMDVDLSSFNGGIYQVELSDRNGARLKVGRVLVQK